MRNESQTKSRTWWIFEDGGTFGKQGTLLRLFDVVLEGHQAVFAGLVEEFVHHLQRVDVGLLAVFGARENADDSAGDLGENVERIGDEDGADGGAADDEQFGGLEEDADIAVLHQIAGDYCAEDNHDADDGKHRSVLAGGMGHTDREGGAGLRGLISAECGLCPLQK